MAEPLLIDALSKIGPGVAAVGLGWLLRQSVLNENDGEVCVAHMCSVRL